MEVIPQDTYFKECGRRCRKLKMLVIWNIEGEDVMQKFISIKDSKGSEYIRITITRIQIKTRLEDLNAISRGGIYDGGRKRRTDEICCSGTSPQPLVIEQGITYYEIQDNNSTRSDAPASSRIALNLHQDDQGNHH